MTSHLTTGRARGATITGAAGHLADIHATITADSGSDDLHTTDKPSSGLREARDPVRAAIINSGQAWPSDTITITVAPASLPGQGSALDLAMAVAILSAAGQVPASAASDCLLAAELGLDGRLRPVRGILPAGLAATAAGITTAVVSPDNAAEAALAPGITVISCPSLPAVLAWLRGDPGGYTIIAPSAASAPDLPVGPGAGLRGPAVPPLTRRILEACAAGGHHLRMTGSPHADVPALAAAAAALLPPLTRTEALEVAAIHSAAGILDPGRQAISRPPYQAPHHTITPAAMLGGGPGTIRSGVAPLAHHGVLFLENAPEFARDVLAALRQPLHHRTVTIARGGATVQFPARFILIASMGRCPCGSTPGCACTPLQAARYQRRLTRDLGSYFDLHLSFASGRPEESDMASAARVAAARAQARRRLAGAPWRLNADIPGPELRRRYQPPPLALAAVNRAIDNGQLSIQAASRVVRVAWTLADLDGQPQPGKAECDDALALHLGTMTP
jgi:magnesium chelatase family protein